MNSPIDDSTRESEDKSPQNILHDSMVTVRLSEPPPSLHLNTTIPLTASGISNGNLYEKKPQDSPSRLLEVQEDAEEDAEEDVEEEVEKESPRITMLDPNGNEVLSPSGSESAGSPNGESRRGSDSSEASVEGGGVNWEELEKTEEQEPRSESSDDVSLSYRFFRNLVHAADVSVHCIVAG
jgi:hypothetical protein